MDIVGKHVNYNVHMIHDETCLKAGRRYIDLKDAYTEAGTDR